MLSPKPWKWDAIVRLLIGAFVCLGLGPIVVSALHYAAPSGRSHAVFLALSGAGFVLLIISLIVLSSQWSQEDPLRQLLILLACLSGGLSFAAWSQKIARLPDESRSGEQMVVAEAAVLLFFVGFLRARRVKWSEAFGFKNNRRHAIMAGMAVACIFLPVAEGLKWGSYHLMTNLRLEPQEQEVVRALRVTDAWSNRLVLGLLALFLAPVVEELLFRGMLYPAIKQAGFPRLAIWGVSLLFALVHANLFTFVPLFVLAILLTLLYEHTDNLLAPITTHALFNALNFGILYLLEKPIAR
jgi:membrane protease YdiL (CAAX protease family)